MLSVAEAEKENSVATLIGLTGAMITFLALNWKQICFT